jgi:hypothetical protein
MSKKSTVSRIQLCLIGLVMFAAIAACTMRRSYSMLVELRAEEFASIADFVVETASRTNCELPEQGVQWRAHGKRRTSYCEPVDPGFVVVEFEEQQGRGTFTVSILELHQHGPIRPAVRGFAEQMRHILESRFGAERIAIKTRNWDP